MKKYMNSSNSFSKASDIIALSIILGTVTYAWTGPTDTAPNGNVPAPINIGATIQEKMGSLKVRGPFTISGGNKGYSELTQSADDPSTLATKSYVDGKSSIGSGVENGNCSPTGAVAVDTNGVLLSCQSLVWVPSFKIPGSDLVFAMNYYMAGNTYDTTAQRRVTGAITDGSGGLLVTAFADSCCSYSSSQNQSYVCSRSASQSTYGCYFSASPGSGYSSYYAYGRAKISGKTIYIYTCGLSPCGPTGTSATGEYGTFVGSVTAP